jgi:uncharacterized protein YdhG (YjbR/CyaY superfamily)
VAEVKLMANVVRSKAVDAYIAQFPATVQAILKKIRATARKAAPGAREVISYRMPALKQRGILVYYAAFAHHIGLYPPIRGNAALLKRAAPYANEKGNLRFPYEEAIPYGLIADLTRMRARQEAEGVRTERPRTRKHS